MERRGMFSLARIGAMLLMLAAVAAFAAVRPASAQDDVLVIDLGELNDSGVSGTAELTDNGDGTTVMGDCAFGEDHWRHFVDFAERRWIVVLPKGVDTDSVRGTLVQQSSGFGDRTLKWTVFGAAGHVPRPESLL